MVSAMSYIKIANGIFNKSITSNEFFRLKKFFINSQNYKTYDSMVASANNKIIGNIPEEIISVIVKEHPQTKVDLIKNVQDAFGKMALELKKSVLSQPNLIANIKGKSAEEKFITSVMLNHNWRLPEDFNKIPNGISKKLKESLSKILPVSKVKISFVGEGSFGYVYKLECMDNSGNKVIHDRAIKIYKDKDSVKDVTSSLLKKMSKLMNKYSDDEVIDMVFPFAKDSSMFRTSSNKEIKKMIPFLRKSYIRGDLNKRVNMAVKMFKNSDNIHGICAEANSYTRLKHLLGHKISKSNIIPTDMFELGKGYSIAKFSDSSLPKVESEIKFSELGLVDIDYHPGNIVENRLIDFGGIKTKSDLISDNTVIKYYKKILHSGDKNAQLKTVENLKKIASNPKTPLRDKILKAIDYYINN